MAKYDLNTQLKKEGLKALKIWNGAMIGSLALIAIGCVGMGVAAVKTKLDADARAKDPAEFADWIKNHIKDAPHVKMEDLENMENDDITEDGDE